MRRPAVLGSDRSRLPLRQLNRAPRTLPLYVRSLAPAIPGLGRASAARGNVGEIPALVLELEGVKVAPAHLGRYRDLCGFAAGGPLPCTYPDVLAFPLQLALMSERSFPIAQWSLVRLANRICVHRALDESEALNLEVRGTPLERHERGEAFTVISEANVSGEIVWVQQAAWLHPRQAQTQAPLRPALHPALSLSDNETWAIPGGLGRRYAAISGDRNPVHLHRASARLYGSRHASAHAMWGMARCMAALAPAPDPPYIAEVEFAEPIRLPSRVLFSQAAGGRQQRFCVRSGARAGRIHLTGSLHT